MRSMIICLILYILLNASYMVKGQFVPNSPCDTYNSAAGVYPADYTWPPGQDPFVCSGHGYCVNGTDPKTNQPMQFCLCDNKYANVSCNYKRKSQLLVFLMSFFFGTLGVERFILGLTATAAGKLVLSCGICVVACVLGIVAAVCGADTFGGSAAIITYKVIAGLWGLAVFGWWLADVILTGMNTLKDSHHYAPYSW